MRLAGPNPTYADSTTLGTMLRPVFHAEVCSFRLMHDGAFGSLYEVGLDGPIDRVVVKLQKYTGRAEIEQRHLAELRRRSPVRIPEVHACLPAAPGSPEALVLDYLPGVEGRRLGNLAPSQRAVVGRSVIDTLCALHEHEHPGGCGELDGPWYERWVDYYRPWIEDVLAELQGRAGSPESPDPLVLQVGERALACIEEVFTGCDAPAVLIHGDFCLGNLLFDPDTLQVTGLIDPLDSAWGDAERDLVHLAKSDGHRYGFLEEYQRRFPPDDRFELRYWFTMFWTWVSYDAAIGLRNDAWYRSCAQRLRAELDRAML
jgi:aminoglycoside phosphotransferase (APT) family kinase protein